MNEWLASVGLSASKPLLTALLLPPTPFLILILLGCCVARRRPMFVRWAAASTALLVWFSSCSAVAELLEQRMLPVYPSLAPARLAELRGHAAGRVAIIVLGAGVEDFASEYNASNLELRSAERLRYGIWLARRIRWPVGFSGGIGWGQTSGTSATEAAVAQRIATTEFQLPLQWVEDRSRDTHENAVNTVALLKSQGISEVLLVTHRWHMARAIRNFQDAARGAIRIEAAPIGRATRQELLWLRWMPSGEGVTLTRQVVRERLGLFLGA